MESQDLISIQIFCNHYKIPLSFINTLSEFELIDITVIEDDLYIHTAQIGDVEKMIRLHYDLDINLEGIDAIYNLLRQMNSLKQEVTALENRLRFYEDI